MAALRRWSCLDSQGFTTYRKVWPDTCPGGQLTRRFAPRAPNVGTVTGRAVRLLGTGTAVRTSARDCVGPEACHDDDFRQIEGGPHLHGGGLSCAQGGA